MGSTVPDSIYRDGRRYHLYAIAENNESAQKFVDRKRNSYRNKNNGTLRYKVICFEEGFWFTGKRYAIYFDKIQQMFVDRIE